jgi:hypothetical protein
MCNNLGAAGFKPGNIARNVAFFTTLRRRCGLSLRFCCTKYSICWHSWKLSGSPPTKCSVAAGDDGWRKESLVIGASPFGTLLVTRQDAFGGLFDPANGRPQIRLASAFVKIKNRPAMGRDSLIEIRLQLIRFDLEIRIVIAYALLEAGIDSAFLSAAFQNKPLAARFAPNRHLHPLWYDRHSFPPFVARN